jgi:hypothetical protein
MLLNKLEMIDNCRVLSHPLCWTLQRADIRHEWVVCVYRGIELASIEAPITLVPHGAWFAGGRQQGFRGSRLVILALLGFRRDSTAHWDSKAAHGDAAQCAKRNDNSPQVSKGC